MNTLRSLLALALVIGVVGGVRAQEKKAEDIKKQIVGSWEVIKSDDADAVGSTVEFGPDGTIKITKKGDGEKAREGTYTVDGDRLVVTHKGNDNPLILSIKKLTADELMVEHDGKTFELSRKKAAK